MLELGEIIGIKNIIFGQAIFFGSGFFMVKMELWHPWILLALIYAVALGLTIKKLKFMQNKGSKEEYNRNSLIFSLAILGAGVFSYYQGRSNSDLIIIVSYPAVILIGIFLDTILENFLRYSKIGKVFSGIIFIVIFSVLANYSASAVYSTFKYEFVKSRLNKEELFKNNFIEENLKVAKKLKEILGKIDFVSQQESYYYLETEQKDLKRFPARVDLFTFEDVEKIIEFMKEENTSICINTDIYRVLNAAYGEEINKLLEEKYKTVELEQYDWIIFVNEENFENISKIEEIL